MNRSLLLSLLPLGFFFVLPSCLLGDANDTVYDDTSPPSIR